MATKINKYTWRSWIRGLNTLQNNTNIRDDELSVALNIILTDEGQPVRRPGSNYFGDTSNSIETPTPIPHYDKSGVNKLLVISNRYALLRNDGTGALSTVTSAASWVSSSRYNWAMLNNVTYIASDADPLTKYDGTYLTRFTTINAPTLSSVTRGASLISGATTLSYKITAENSYGETNASAAVTVQVDRARDQWNFDPTSPSLNYSVLLSWSAVAGAVKYNVYGVRSGSETYIDSVSNGATSYRDYGIKTPSIFFAAPTGNSTDAPRGEYIGTYKSALIIGGDPNEPSRLYHSAGVDKPDSFTISDGGGWVDINKNADDGVITGFGTYQDSLVVFKDYSVWKFDFTASALPSLTNLRQGLGCVSHKTIKPVENDLFFLGKTIGSLPAVYVLGNEPNFLTVLRTNEISARVRNEITLTYQNYKKATAAYRNNSYHLFFADGSSAYNNLGLVYDRQRLGFTKWDSVQVENALVWRDSSNTEKLIYGDGLDKRMSEISDNFGDDKGEPIVWEIRTKQQKSKDISLYERTKWVNFTFESPNGDIDFRFYHDDSVTTFNNSLGSRSTNTAFGYFGFRQEQFRTNGVLDTEVVSNMINRKFPLHRLGMSAVSNSFGVGVRGTGEISRAILLSVEFERKAMSKNYRLPNEIYQI